MIHNKSYTILEYIIIIGGAQFTEVYNIVVFLNLYINLLLSENIIRTYMFEPTNNGGKMGLSLRLKYCALLKNYILKVFSQ